jgi:hypothetical protein
MRANEFIAEVFAPGKTNWEWARLGTNEVSAFFNVGGREYLWQAFTGVANPKKWEIQFRLIRKPDEDPDDLDLFGKTGTGNSAEVMSTAVDITRAFLKEYGLDRVEEITFNAKDEPKFGATEKTKDPRSHTRPSLYAKMIKRLLPGWDLYSKKDPVDGMTFSLTDRRAYDKPENKLGAEVLDEMPLPADWDPQQMRQQSTTFKSRLAYALERAKKLGTGSSRIATVIEYQGRPTVLKIAKNAKGLAQNSVEADILGDGYASQLGILIPLIDYDEQNREPSWIHTEMATKASEKQLCNMMKCDNLHQLVNMAYAITGKKRYVGTYQSYIDHMQQAGKSEQDIETMSEYANTLADLNSNFDIELADFARAANWGIYQGKPVIIDAGFNSNVLSQYYSR